MRNKLISLKEEYRQEIDVLQQKKMSTKLQTVEQQVRIDQARLEGKIELIDELLRTDLRLKDQADV